METSKKLSVAADDVMIHKCLLLGSSPEGGAGGSVGQAVAAGEDRGGKETSGRETEEV